MSEKAEKVLAKTMKMETGIWYRVMDSTEVDIPVKGYIHTSVAKGVEDVAKLNESDIFEILKNDGSFEGPFSIIEGLGTNCVVFSAKLITL